MERKSKKPKNAKRKLSYYRNIGNDSILIGINNFKKDNNKKLTGKNTNIIIIEDYQEKTSVKVQEKISMMRELQLPKAIKAIGEEGDLYFRSSYINTPINVKGAKIYISTIQTSLVIHAEFNLANKYYYLFVTDHLQYSGTDMTIKETFYFYYNECNTKTANDIYLPLGFINYNNEDYAAVITTGLESGGKCTGQYGHYVVIKSNYAGGPNYSRFEYFSPSSGSNGGAGYSNVFYDPNGLIQGENLGLPAFSGYTECVDLSMQLLTTSASSSAPVSIALVYYEDT